MPKKKMEDPLDEEMEDGTDETAGIDGDEVMNLEDLDEYFEKAPDTSEVPVDIYQVKVFRAELGYTSTKLRVLKLQFKILNGKFAGRLIFKNLMLDTKTNTPEAKLQQLSFLKQDLGRMGIKIEKASQIPGILDELVDTQLEVKTADGKPGTDGRKMSNVYINRVLDGAVEAAAAADEDDAEF